MSSATVFSRILPLSIRRRVPFSTALLATALAVVPAHSRAQTPGSVDPTFASFVSGLTVYSILPSVDVDTPDATTGAPLYSLIVGGDTEEFERVPLPSGGVHQETNALNFGSGGRIVYTIVADQYGPDPGKYYAGGLFGRSSTQTIPPSNIFRLNSNFTLDASFNPGTGADNYVTSILPTPDGKIVVGGLFNNFNGLARRRLVRLNADGTVDGTYNPALSFDGDVLSLAMQIGPATGIPNGQVIVGGLFNNVSGAPATKVVRLNNDGTRDVNFGPTIDTRVNTVAVQSNGKILIGGDFSVVNGVAVSKIARLNPDGGLDPTFTASISQVPSTNINAVAVYTIQLLPDGRMYVGGNFINVDGLTRQYLALLNADGSVDTSFDPGTNLANAVQTIYPDPFTGDVYLGETVINKVNNAFPSVLVALYGVPPLPTTAPGVAIDPVDPTPVTAPTPDNATTVNIVRKGKVVGGSTEATVSDGAFVLTRSTEDASQDLLVQLQVSGNIGANDATIQGFPGVSPGGMITYTFPAGETTGMLPVMHRDSPRAGKRHMTLTVLNPQDGVTTYAAGDHPQANLPILNPVIVH